MQANTSIPHGMLIGQSVCNVTMQNFEVKCAASRTTLFEFAATWRVSKPDRREHPRTPNALAQSGVFARETR